MNPSPRTLTTTLLLAALVAAGCTSPPDHERTGNAAAALEPRPVTVAAVEQRTVTPVVEATGTLVADRHVAVRALVAGEVEELPVEIGTPVRRGDLLFRVRTVDAELGLQQAEANMARAEAQSADRERELQRLTNLLAEGSATGQMRDQAETGLQDARAALRQTRAARDTARQHLDDCTIPAPFAGVVTARHLDAGEFVNRGQPVVELMDHATLNAEVDLPERHAGQVEPGMPVEVRIQGRPAAVPGRITAVNPRIDTATRTFRVKVAVNNRDRALQAGLFCTARITLPAREDLPAVPAQALSRDEGRTWVWLVEDGRARRRPVQEGPAADGWVTILEGLTPGDTVVVDGAGGLLDGAPVAVRPS